MKIDIKLAGIALIVAALLMFAGTITGFVVGGGSAEAPSVAGAATSQIADDTSLAIKLKPREIGLPGYYERCKLVDAKVAKGSIIASEICDVDEALYVADAIKLTSTEKEKASLFYCCKDEQE